MRKNKMMRAASALLVAVLLTTSTISGTFAKYVTETKASDAARVAKWGVELQVVGNLYGDSYGTENKIVHNDDKTVAVQSNNTTHAEDGDDIVAPGTKNDTGFTFSLKGTPEVDGKITSTMTVQNIFLGAGTFGVMVPVDDKIITSENYTEYKEMTNLYYSADEVTFTKAENSFTADVTYYTLEDDVTLAAPYYPVVYKLEGGTTYSGDYNVDTLKLLADKIANGLGITTSSDPKVNSGKYDYSGSPKVFDSNTVLDTFINLDDQVITWAWAFSTSDNLDKADTILGMLEKVTEGIVVKKATDTTYILPVEYTDYCIDTMFNLSITVEQTDEDSQLDSPSDGKGTGTDYTTP